MLLRVELDADLADELELGLEEVDVVLLVRRQLLEQVLGDAIVRRFTMASGFEVKRARVDLGGEVQPQRITV